MQSRELLRCASICCEAILDFALVKRDEGGRGGKRRIEVVVPVELRLVRLLGSVTCGDSESRPEYHTSSTAKTCDGVAVSLSKAVSAPAIP